MAQANSLIMAVAVLYMSGCLAATKESMPNMDESLAKQDYRIMVQAGSNGSVPGVADGLQDEAKQRCGVRYMKGDFEQLLTYATVYNRLMLKHCMPQAPKKKQSKVWPFD